MSAFEDINAADFDMGGETTDDLILTGSWYNAAGELDLNAIQSLREQTIKQSEISNSQTLSESLEFNASSELARGLLALSSFDNRPRILDLKGTHARILLDAIQTVRVHFIAPVYHFPMNPVAGHIQARRPYSSSAPVPPHQAGRC
jgi:hypothetical protein